MLTVDLINVRTTRDGALVLPELKESDLALLRALAVRLLDATRAGIGRSRAEVVELVLAIDVHPKLARAKRALTKLIDDASRYGGGAHGDVSSLRRTLFRLAAAHRRALAPDDRFDRAAVVDQAAAALALTPDDVEARLFSDLREQDELAGVDIADADELVVRYELGRLMAVVLRAERLSVRIASSSPDALRRALHALRFHQLLFMADTDDDGVCLTIDGPLSLVEATTRYGLKLALVVPHLLAAGAHALRADVRHGVARRRLTFAPDSLEPFARAAAALRVAPLGERAEVRALKDAMAKQRTWRVDDAAELFTCPGLGFVVPDVVCTHDDGTRIFVELLGHWSRDAVWKRVDLVLAGALPSMVFAAPKKLRVDARALPAESGAALVVYNDVLGVRALVAALEAVRLTPAAKRRRQAKDKGGAGGKKGGASGARAHGSRAPTTRESTTRESKPRQRKPSTNKPRATKPRAP